MLLVLDELEGLRVEDLLARRSKAGDRSARGPFVAAEGAPLGDLKPGDKLNIAARGSQAVLSGMSPGEFVERLRSLGLSNATRLKQIHLIADDTGVGGAASFAALLDRALQDAGFAVDELKAPVGAVRCDAAGKIWVRLAPAGAWQPSGPSLNFYTGPHMAAKHGSD